MDRPREWYEPIWFPTRPLEDPRLRPGHHALLLGLHRLTAPHLFGERNFYEYGDDRHALPFAESVVLRQARMGVQALPRLRRDLAQWGYVGYRHCPGYASAYDIVTFDEVSEPGLFFPIPAMVADDYILRPGHLAAYLALAHAAEQQRLEELPDNAGDLEVWEAPMFGSRCVLRGKELDAMAGFRHSTTRNRYLRELVHLGHAQIAHAQKHLPSTYRLLANAASDRALRAHLKEQDERWWRQHAAGGLPHQQEGAT